MQHRARFPLLVITAFLVLLLSAVAFRPAFADDAPPPSDTPTTSTSATTDASTATTDASTATATTDSVSATASPAATDATASPVPTDATTDASTATAVATASATPAPTQDAALATNTATPAPTSTSDPASSPTASPSPTADAPTATATDVPSSASDTSSTASLPAGTTVVALDSSGNPLPLASQQAAAVIATGDPIWCPSGVAPNPLKNGCSDWYTGLDQLVASFVPTTNGVIWMQTGNDGSTNDITIDGSGSWSSAAGFSLSFAGGWNGTYGSTGINSSPTIMGHSLTVTNWNGPITLSDLYFLSAPTNATQPYQLYVKTTKSVKLTRVTATASSSLGGVSISSGSNVSILNGLFTSNHGTNLDVFASGSITLSTVEADASAAGYGTHLDNVSSPVVLTNVIDNNNFLDGLNVDTGGSLTLTNLTSASNGGDGANLFGGDGSFVLTNLDTIANGGGGLHAVTLGSVTATNLASQGNFADGINLDNHTSATFAGVTLNSVSSNTNTGWGFFLYSGGPVAITSLTANLNAAGGVYIQNNVGPAKPITMSGTNLITGSGFDGLAAYSNGAITIHDLIAIQNGTSGLAYSVYLNNSSASPGQPVTLTGTNAIGQTFGTGLFILSRGAVSISNLTASGVTANSSSYGYGAQIDNTLANGAPVTFTGASVFDSNYNNGLNIVSAGAITLSNITADSNGKPGATGMGAYLDNWSFASSMHFITLTGVNQFSDNGTGGLKVLSYGPFTASNVTASYNGNDGLLVFTSDGLTLTGTNVFNFNDKVGLSGESNRAISISNITAGNNATGVVLDNQNLAHLPVTITGVNLIYQNADDGLVITSMGSVSLSNLTAVRNGVTDVGGTGVSIDNCFYNPTVGACTAPVRGSVTLSGVNTFDGNYTNGLLVKSLGAISLSNVSASDIVSDYGLEILAEYAWNPTATLGGDVAYSNSLTISGYLAGNHDGLAAIEANVNGAITLNNVTANDDGLLGVFLDNRTAAHMPVILNGTNVFLNDAARGLYILSYGLIQVSNVTAVRDGISFSTGPGVYLDNCDFNAVLSACTTPVRSPVILTGTNTFNDNYSDGLRISTAGPVSISNLTALSNQGHGLEVGGFGNWDPTAVPSTFVVYVDSLTISGYANVSSNAVGGIDAALHGPVTLANVTATANGSSGGNDGVNILTRGFYGAGGTTSPSSVLLTGTNTFSFNGNGSGLVITADGNITINNLIANNNGENGAILDNYAAWSGSPFAKPNLTLLGFSSLSGNQFDGLNFASPGAVTLNNVNALSNGWNGIETGVASTSITLHCGLLLGNTLSGLVLDTSGTLSLLGTLSIGNGNVNLLTYLHLIQTVTCP